MPRARKVKPILHDTDIRHHLIPELPARVVASLQIKRNNRLLDNVGAELTLDELKEHIRDRWGKGRYMVSATNAVGAPLEGYTVIEITEDETDLGGGVSMLGSNNPMGIGVSDGINAFRDIYIEQQRNLRQSQDEVAKRRLQEESQRKEEYRSSVELLREQMQTQAAMVKEMIAAALDGSSSLDDTRKDLMRDATEAERVRYENSINEMRKIQEMKDAMWAQQLSLETERWQAKLNANDEKWGHMVSQVKSEFTSQLESMKQINAFELEKIREEHRRQADLIMFEGKNIPAHVVEEVMMRRIEEEYPIKSPLERIAEQYIEPILEIVSKVVPNLKNVLPLPGGQTVQSDQSDQVDAPTAGYDSGDYSRPQESEGSS